MIRSMAGLRGSMNSAGIELISPDRAVTSSGDFCHLADDREYSVHRRARPGCHLNAA
jgi:hypothetical protein